MDPQLLSECDREPIHLASAIQNFGALCVIDLETLCVLQASANFQSFLELPDSSFYGEKVGKLLGSGAETCVVERRSRFYFEGRCAKVIYQEFLAVIEIESLVASDPAMEFATFDDIQSSDTLNKLLANTTQVVSQLTGLDRVMVYQFHEDLHGEVVAESIKPGVQSYLGLHYPASDIPLPARAVFLKTWVRMIPDAESAPVGLIPIVNPKTGKPLDLGVSLLRAVSPVHLEYLANMGVAASLTISLIVDGKLWGLIACHHRERKYIGVGMRDSCEAIGRLASAFISVRTTSDREVIEARYREVHQRLVEHLRYGIDMAAELTRQVPNLLDLIFSEGSAAALYLEGSWASVGNTPPPEKLNAIVDWLVENKREEVLYCTNNLAAEFPASQEMNPVFCGLMALAIPITKRHYVLWFRPELITTVSWAGKPEKWVDESGGLHPRASFALWVEEVKGRSEPWTKVEKQAALELRNAIMAVDLQKQHVREQEARIEAERATKAREELMEVLSHDLKNPLGSIRLSAQFANQFLNAESFEKVRPYLARIAKTTASMDSLISDILSITKLEAGYSDTVLEMVDVAELLLEVVELVAPIAQDKGITLTTECVPTACLTLCDRGQIFQVISNILGNALKFTDGQGKISIALNGSGTEYMRLKISDTGPGIPPENLSNIFDRFWQAQQTKRLGTGLGLAIVKAIITAHHGRVWAESDGKNGSSFCVLIPLLK
ncbi:MAG: GAF domain-containing protein [Bdellovibrionales bacterium]|nr:GAF domain-containing protein [Oligoflexia bacterium]